MDVHAIATALADRFSAANVTPPSGYDDIALATAELPNAITSLPAVLVFPPDGTWSFNAGASRVGDLRFMVRVYLGPMLDTGRNAEMVNKWHSVLIEQIIGRLALGQGTNGVTHAFITSSSSGMIDYADIKYVGIELEVTVHLVEAINPVQ
jgi:hypothetical protein